MRAYLRLGLFFYFKRIDIRNTNTIPKNEAVIFLGNHQNALLDALLIATKNGRFSYFLTRAGVFTKPLVSKFLKSLQAKCHEYWKNNDNYKKALCKYFDTQGKCSYGKKC
jgi:1-acyl-sn-glycerol-3-phosphate acyltransferase